jgi:hypothetical protein
MMIRFLILTAMLALAPQFSIPMRTGTPVASAAVVVPVGSLVCTSSGTTNVPTWVLNISPAHAGDQIVVLMGALAATTLTATDDGGSVYVPLDSQNPSSVMMSIAGTLSVSGSTTKITETETGGGSQVMTLCAQEFSGTLHFGTTAHGTSSTSTTSWTGSLTTHGETGNYVLSAINTAAGVTFTATTGSLLGFDASIAGSRGVAVMGGSATAGATVTQAGNIGSTPHALAQVMVELRAH